MENKKVKQEPSGQQAVPFFARYLEGQEYPKVKTNIQVGARGGGGGIGPGDFPPAVTLKWPSDGDDDPIAISY